MLPSGELVGLSWAQWKDTQISFALPLSIADRLVSGQPGSPQCAVEPTARPLRLRVVLPLLDVNGRVRQCRLHLVPQAMARLPKPPEDGQWQLLAKGMTVVPLEVNHQVGTGNQTLAETGLMPGEYWAQASTTLDDGTQLVSPPVELTVPRPHGSTTPYPQPTGPDLEAMVNPAFEAVAPPAPKPVPQPHAPPASVPRPPVEAPGPVGLFPLYDLALVHATAEVSCEPLCAKRLFTRQIGGLSLTEFSLRVPIAKRQGQQLAEDHRLVETMGRRWAPKAPTAKLAEISVLVPSTDGKAFFTLRRCSKTGNRMEVSRFGCDGDTPTARAELDQIITQLIPTRRGLLAVAVGRGLLLLDPDTLRLQKRLSIPTITRLNVPSAGNFAVGVSNSRFSIGSGRDGELESCMRGTPAALHVVDLEAWRQVRVYRGTATPMRTVAATDALDYELAQPIVCSDDGKYVLVGRKTEACSNTYLALHRFRDGTLDSDPVELFRGQPQEVAPVPNSARFLAAFRNPVWRRENPPLGAPNTRQPYYALLDAAKPGNPVAYQWFDRACFAADHLIAIGPDGSIRDIGPDGTEEERILVSQSDGLRTSMLQQPIGTPYTRTAVIPCGETWFLLAPSASPAPAPGESPAIPAPPAATALSTTAAECRDLKWKAADLPAGPDGKYLGRLSPDGKSVLVIDAKGKVRRVTLPDFAETLVADEDSACTGIALARPGFLVALADTGVSELRLHDKDTFRLLGRLPLPELPATLLASPMSPRVVVVTQRQEILVCNCETGTIEQRYNRLPLPERIPETAPSGQPTGAIAFAMSPDGTHVFAIPGCYLCRYRLDENGLVPDTVSPSNLVDPMFLSMDDGGRYLAAASRGGCAMRIGWGPAHRSAIGSHYSLTVFDAATLLPVLQSPCRKPNGAIFDSANGWVLDSNLVRHVPPGTPLVRSYPASLGRAGFQVLGVDAEGATVGLGDSQLYRLRFVGAALTQDQLKEAFR